MANKCPNCSRIHDIIQIGEVLVSYNTVKLIYEDGGPGLGKFKHVAFGCKACGSHWLRPRGEVKDES